MTGAKKANTRLAGHELPNEGRLYAGGGWYQAGVEGSATCSCGAKSKKLPNASQRKKWHRAHKDDIRNGGDGEVEAP